MSFQSKDDKVLSQQLKVQELVVKLSDSQLVSVSGSDVTIDVGENVSSVLCAIHFDDSVAAGAGIKMVNAADVAISSSQITLTLQAALAAADAVLVKYIISE